MELIGEHGQRPRSGSLGVSSVKDMMDRSEQKCFHKVWRWSALPFARTVLGVRSSFSWAFEGG